MVVERKGKSTYLVCKKCGKKKKFKGKFLVTEVVSHPEEKKIVVMKRREEEEELPKTKIICPKCGNDEAYWYMQQTRSADEPPTLFYKCTKCGYSWRSYG